VIQATFTRASYTLADVAPSGAVGSHTRNFNGEALTAYYNVFTQDLGLPGEALFGLSFGYGKGNNYMSLKSVQICDELASQGGTTPRTISKCKDGRLGSYNEANRISSGLNVIWYQNWLNKRLALGLAGGYDGSKSKNRWSSGVGLLLLKGGSPLSVIGAVTAEQVDGKWRLGLQAGFPF
jgi:hypothetical protein